MQGWLSRAARAGALLAVALAWQAQASAGSENVIVVVIDGARYTETFGDPQHRYIPKIWNQLRPQGTIHTGVYNRGQTLTLSAHATMPAGNNTWMGLAPNPEVELLHPFTPTLFEYFRAATGADATQAWMVANQGAGFLEGVTFSTHPGYGPAYGGSWHRGPTEDPQVALDVSSILDQYHPRLMMVNLHNTDRWGHAGDWAKYTKAIATADGLVYQLWQKIQSDPFYANQTTLIITCDHGRHTRDFKEHGDCCGGCQHVMFLALGPQIRSNYQATGPRRYLPDIGVTAGWLMGVPMPYAIDGTVMTELLAPGTVVAPSGNSYLESLGVSAATTDAQGIPCSVFHPGETVGLQVTVHNLGAKQVSIYQQLMRTGTCANGEVCEWGWFCGNAPVSLAPDGQSTALTYFRLPDQTGLGEWPLLVECEGVEETGAVVIGAGSVSLVVESPLTGSRLQPGQAPCQQPAKANPALPAARR